MDLTPSISANRPDALFIGPRPFSFVFLFFLFFLLSIAPPRGSEHTHCSNGPRPFSSLFFFFFPCHLVAQSRHTAQSVLDHFPSFFFFFFFFFHATSWLRANTLPNRSSTVFSFITPPRGSEQTCCTIAPNHFFFNNSPLLFPLTPPRGSEQKQTLAEATRPAPFPRDK